MSDGQRFFVFVRAINVGGRRLTNSRLIEPFVRLGFDDVAAYQAAGNLTFRTDAPSRVRPEHLSAALSDAYGFDTQAFVRSCSELRAIAGSRPFSDEEMNGTERRVQISFLQRQPPAETIADVLALVPPDDRVVFSGCEWFWLPSRSIADSRLPVSTIEDLLGQMTMRTLGTVTRMLSRFDRD